VDTNKTRSLTDEPGGPKGPPGGPLRRWLSFIIAMIVIFGGASFAPHLEDLDVVGQRIKVVRESGMETSAFFYGAVPRIGEIEWTLLHIRDYNPARNFKGAAPTGKPVAKPPK
jgi:hypothetical protein